MHAKHKILYIEDDPTNKALVRKLLTNAGYLVVEADDGVSGIEAAKRERPGLILMDMQMPGLDGYEATTRIKGIPELADTPVIAVTANAMKGDRERSLTAGCDGHIAKPIDIDHFVAEVESYRQGKQESVNAEDQTEYLKEYSHKLVGRLEEKVRELEAINSELEGKVQARTSELNDTVERLAQIAQYDDLTGLPNRVLFRERLDRAMARATRNGTEAALLFLDLDRFKSVNDTLGHDCGDQLLKTTAQRLQGCLRKVDTVARWGGDEFAVILEDVPEPHGASVVAQKLIDVFALPFQLREHEVFVTTSIGIAVYPSCGKDAETLTRNADVAMYRAKEQGRNNHQFYIEDLTTRAYERLRLDGKLRRALEREEFLLHYQPILDASSGTIVGVEALLRWQIPGENLISPADFIPLLEETGQIVPVGEWVLRTACAQNRAWQEAGSPPVRMAVNLSVRQFRGRDLVGTVQCVLDDTGLDPRFLILEITEGILMDDSRSSSDVLTRTRDMGIEIAIDDFGTGYSSLSYLKRFPIDILKIDRSFINDISEDPDDSPIVKAIIAMAHSLRLKVVAEGVETQEQLDFLCDHGCDAIQGFLVGRPMPAEAFAAWLQEQFAFPAEGAA